MSLPRSIDRSDLGAGPVSLTGTTETLVLTSPNLQTPKDSSFIVAIISFQVTLGASATGVTARVRQGNSLSGATIGQPYGSTGYTAATNVPGCFIMPATVSQTDYVQWSLTLQQFGATGAGSVTAATILMFSF